MPLAAIARPILYFNVFTVSRCLDSQPTVLWNTYCTIQVILTRFTQGLNNIIALGNRKLDLYFLVCLMSAVSPVIALSPAVLSVIEDQQLTLPCVLLVGNPLPERKWLHNYGLVSIYTVDMLYVIL